MRIPPELLTVAKHLGNLTEKTVFVGGMIRGLLITDPAAGAARPTDDVDLIVNVPTYKDFADLNETLRSRGFNESMEEGAPICRWVVDGIRTDIMPIDPRILGFTNVWYADAMDHAVVIAGPDGNLRTLDAPHFCATKLEAFASRGDGDYLHRDIEDFIAVVDGRSTLIAELAASLKEVRTFVAEVVAGLVATQAFIDILPGHLEGDAGSQARLPLLVECLRKIAALGSVGVVSASPRARKAPATPLVPRAFSPPPVIPSSGPSGRVALRSSNVRAAEYDAATQILTIEFHSGSVYRYSRVPATIFQGLVHAYSAGRYHHQWIRERYSYHRVR